eukprot:TRINITY_DN61763_c0_g1_i1.p1 TRINITY_DN61763_c0_g1~~TRINITY_DN61763_c0_g1_i1.p1  ORF type:complete len:320 (-),score=32.47 TRINITY_DN61763_c0_g1_i1:1074-2033(-)
MLILLLRVVVHQRAKMQRRVGCLLICVVTSNNNSTNWQLCALCQHLPTAPTVTETLVPTHTVTQQQTNTIDKQHHQYRDTQHHHGNAHDNDDTGPSPDESLKSPVKGCDVTTQNKQKCKGKGNTKKRNKKANKAQRKSKQSTTGDHESAAECSNVDPVAIHESGTPGGRRESSPLQGAFGGVDIVLGSDCLFEKKSFDSMFSTVHTLLTVSQNNNCNQSQSTHNVADPTELQAGVDASVRHTTCSVVPHKPVFLCAYHVRNSKYDIVEYCEKWGLDCQLVYDTDTEEPFDAFCTTDIHTAGSSHVLLYRMTLKTAELAR